MRPRVKVRLAIVPFTLALLAAGSTGSSSGASGSGALARAYVIRVVVPGGGAATPTISSPPSDAVAPGSGFSYARPDGPAGTAGTKVSTGTSETTGDPFPTPPPAGTPLSLIHRAVNSRA